MAGFDNRSGFTFGDVVIAPYAMPGEDAATPRSCVIVSSNTYNQQRVDVLIMGIVIQKRPDARSGEMSVLDADAAGLDKGAAFKPVLMTVEQRMVRLIVGRLDHRDRDRLRHLLDIIVGA